MIVAGFMSGTSMDGLDCCIAQIDIDSNLFLKYEIIANKSFEFDDKLRSKIKSFIGETDKGRLNEIDDLLGKKYLHLSKSFLSEYSFDAIAIHGQTVHHLDKKKSIQVGSPYYLASFFKVPVIHQFRKKDIYYGGNGAPLMPFLDWLLFKKQKKNILTLNLGGIANISFIPKRANCDNIIGFDTGPGMSLIDESIDFFWQKGFDCNGIYSSKGKINDGMLNYLVDNSPFIFKVPPKSTGREDFGLNFLNKTIKHFNHLNKNDIVRTLVKFSSLSIKLNIERFVSKKYSLDGLVVSGGGEKHPILMSDIKKDLDIPIFNILDYGVESRFKESLLMSVLGYAKIKNIKSNIPNVTGALKNVVLGEIYGN